MLTRCSNRQSKTPISMRDARKDAIEMAARRERLLEAGFRLMSARTIEAVTLQQIADEAKIGIATLYRYFKAKPDLVIEIGTNIWKRYYVEVEKEYARLNGPAMNAAEELEFFLDSIIELYRSRRDVLRFNRNFDTYVQHERCTAAQMRPYNDAVAVFAKKFHTVVRKARADGTIDIRVSEPQLFVNLLYIMVSVAGKYAEGLVYPPHGEQDMTDGLLMLKRMILDSLTGSRR